MTTKEFIGLILLFLPFVWGIISLTIEDGFWAVFKMSALMLGVFAYLGLTFYLLLWS